MPFTRYLGQIYSAYITTVDVSTTAKSFLKGTSDVTFTGSALLSEINSVDTYSKSSIQGTEETSTNAAVYISEYNLRFVISGTTITGVDAVIGTDLITTSDPVSTIYGPNDELVIKINGTNYKYVGSNAITLRGDNTIYTWSWDLTGDTGTFLYIDSVPKPKIT